MYRGDSIVFKFNKSSESAITHYQSTQKSGDIMTRKYIITEE